MNVFFGGGAPLPFLKALRCCGGVALLLRKEWRAAGARISLVVRRRCCPSSALELKKRRAADACEAGPRRLAMSPHIWMGGPHVFFMGDVAGGSAIVPRREGGPAHTQSFVSEPKDGRHCSTGVFSARECCPTRWRLRRVSMPCQRASWAEERTLLRSFSFELLARTCWGRGYPDMRQRPILLGRVGKGEEPCSRWPPFSLEPNGPRD